MDRLEKLQQELQEEKNSRKRLMRQNKSLARQYVEFRQQLAAANARVAELEYKLMAQTETALQEKAKREQAEAQCAKLKEENSKLASAAIEQPPYKNDLLAQNKRIQTAINQYVIGNIELLDAMKAALEEKP